MPLVLYLYLYYGNNITSITLINVTLWKKYILILSNLKPRSLTSSQVRTVTPSTSDDVEARSNSINLFHLSPIGKWTTTSINVSLLHNHYFIYLICREKDSKVGLTSTFTFGEKTKWKLDENKCERVCIWVRKKEKKTYSYNRA